MILNNDGYTSSYFPLKSYSVKKGETVVQGQQIGVICETGTGAMGVHLHIEVRDNCRGKLYCCGWLDDIINPGDYVLGIG